MFSFRKPLETLSLNIIVYKTNSVWHNESLYSGPILYPFLNSVEMGFDANKTKWEAHCWGAYNAGILNKPKDKALCYNKDNILMHSCDTALSLMLLILQCCHSHHCILKIVRMPELTDMGEELLQLYLFLAEWKWVNQNAQTHTHTPCHTKYRHFQGLTSARLWTRIKDLVRRGLEIELFPTGTWKRTRRQTWCVWQGLSNACEHYISSI